MNIFTNIRGKTKISIFQSLQNKFYYLSVDYIKIYYYTTYFYSLNVILVHIAQPYLFNVSDVFY